MTDEVQQEETSAAPEARGHAGVLSDVVADALGSVTAAGAGIALDPKALLSKYGFSHMEKTFSMQDPATGEILQEQDPCYQLLADGFYGQGMHATFFMEGATIVIHSPPNQHMKPLNLSLIHI